MSQLQPPTLPNDTLFTATTLPPAPIASPPSPPPWQDDRAVQLLGVEVTDVTRARAVTLLHEMIDWGLDEPMRCVYFVNAHTLNLADADPDYRDVLGRAAYVFNDGTGVRWAARMKGVRLRDNLCGTDLAPLLLSSTPGRRYFLLGADEATIRRAAAWAEMRFPNWALAGFHHGYVTEPEATDRIIDEINTARPDVLLVGMGNPLQERWLDANRPRLRVPVGIGVGGLFDFWAETVRRAPAWIRRIGYEWAWRLLQQPRDKARRYLLGNPAFLLRAVRDRIRA